MNATYIKRDFAHFEDESIMIPDQVEEDHIHFITTQEVFTAITWDGRTKQVRVVSGQDPITVLTVEEV